jgi:hypothetical protein
MIDFEIHGPCGKRVTVDKAKELLKKSAVLKMDPRCGTCKTTVPFADVLDKLTKTLQENADALVEARQHVFGHLDKGIDCPTCDQHAKRYRRGLNSGMAQWLVALLRLNNAGIEWAHIAWIAANIRGVPPAEAVKLPEGGAAGSGDGPKGVHWGLVEDRRNFDTAKKDTGYWRVTDKGREFASGTLALPPYSVIYNNVWERYEGVPITIQKVWETPFNFQDLMNGGPLGL